MHEKSFSFPSLLPSRIPFAEIETNLTHGGFAFFFSSSLSLFLSLHPLSLQQKKGGNRIVAQRPSPPNLGGRRRKRQKVLRDGEGNLKEREGKGRGKTFLFPRRTEMSEKVLCCPRKKAKCRLLLLQCCCYSNHILLCEL